MLTIDLQRCEGCGACVEVCPQGALYLVEGKAMVDASLCDECKDLPASSEAACVAACPTEAITLGPEAVPAVIEMARPPAVRSEPGAIRIQTEREPVPLRAKMVPVVGSLLAWAGREILPVVTDSLLRRLDRWATESKTTSTSRGVTREASASPDRGGEGRRRRRRRRGS